MPLIAPDLSLIQEHPTPFHAPGRCRVTLGGQLLSGQDATGAAWTCEYPGGWAGSPASSAKSNQKLFADGSWSPAGFLASRYYTLNGTVTAASHHELHAALRRLNAEASIGYTTLRVRESDGLDMYAVVRRDGEVVSAPEHDLSARWSASLVADDPYQYDAAIRSAVIRLGFVTGGWSLPRAMPWSIDSTVITNAATLFNLGTRPALPVIRIGGPVAQPVITHLESGRSMRLDLTLDAAQWLTIDVADRSISLVDQASRLGQLTGDWIDLPPGVSTLRYTAATYDPDTACTVTWRDTYA